MLLCLLIISMLETTNAAGINQTVKTTSERFTLIHNENLENLLKEATKLTVLLQAAVPFATFFYGAAGAYLCIRLLRSLFRWAKKIYRKEEMEEKMQTFNLMKGD